MAQKMFSLLSLGVAAAIAVAMAARGADAVGVYTVQNPAINTSGGARFDREFGSPHARQILIIATRYIWRIFQQSSAADRRDPPRILLVVEDADGVAYAVNNEIHLSARYMGQFSGNFRKEVTGVLVHEMVHLLQWGSGAPGGLIEGIADYTRLRAGLGPPWWVGPGEGDRWDKGYDVTARFLEYCEGLHGGFVAELNKKMRNGYSNNYFVEILGKSVDQLWGDYKRRYGKKL